MRIRNNLRVYFYAGIAIIGVFTLAALSCVKHDDTDSTPVVPIRRNTEGKQSTTSHAAASWHNNLGVALMDQGMCKMVHEYYVEAIREFEAARSLDPEFLIAKINLALAHYYSGTSATDDKDKERERQTANEVAEDVLRSDSRNPNAHFLIGLITKHTNPEKALSHFDQVAAIDPDDGSLQYQRGEVLFRLQRYKEAAEALDKAVRAEPWKLEVRYQYYQTLLRLDRRSDAQVQLTAFQDLGGGKSGGNNKTPDYKYARRGKYSEAIASPVEDQVETAQSTESENGEKEKRKLFAEGAKSIGLVFHHSGTSADPEVMKAMNGEAMPAAWFKAQAMKLTSAVGSGIACADFDRDGATDLYVVNANGPCALFHNEGLGNFRDVTASAGVGGDGKSGMAAVFGDYDNDGYPDLLVTTYGNVFLYHNNRNGTFTNIAPQSGVRVPGNYWAAGCAFADVDHDADLDIFICGYVDLANLPKQSALRFPDDFQGLPNLLFRNNSVDRKKPDSPGNKAPLPFTEVGREMKVDGGSTRSLGVVFSDFDNDNAIDFYVVNDGQPNQLFHNNRNRTFTDIAKELGVDISGRKGGVACGDANQDGWSDLFIAGGPGSEGTMLLSTREKRFEPSADFPKIPGPSAATGFFDFDRDGDLDLFVASAGGGGHHLLRNDRKSWREVAEEEGLTGPSVEGSARGAILSDINRDGAPDVTLVLNGGDLKFIRNNIGTHNHWLAVHTVGYYDKDNPQSNLDSIGAKVEVRALGMWQRCEITAGGGYLSGESPALTFGLGDHLSVDFIRSIWPSGIRGAQISLVDNSVTLTEPQGEIPSCPVLYVWNGKRFEMVADMIAGGTIGELVTPTHYLPLDPDEYIKIDSHRIRTDGRDYRFSIVNQFPETDYIEQTRLLVIDHPENVEVVPNERLLTGPPYPKFKVWSIRESRHPVSAVDDHGSNVLSKISRRDQIYHADLQSLPWRGFAQRHSIILDLGQIEQRDQTPVLLLNGYVAWGGSSTALGAGQAGVLYEPPRLEVKDSQGKWRTAIADMGIPAGLPRTITVPISGIFPTSDHHVRISTNMRIYWDEIRVGFADQQQSLESRDVPLISADLRRLGYPRRIQDSPAVFDYYNRVAVRDFPTHQGMFTRYGDVRELLTDRDDKLVIMNHGDEIQLRFAADKLPKLRRGWKRDFIFYLYGYDKSTDVNTAHSLTVNPLPFFKMSGYPYSSNERYPLDHDQARYLMEYNTREW